MLIRGQNLQSITHPTLCQAHHTAPMIPHAMKVATNISHQVRCINCSSFEYTIMVRVIKPSPSFPNSDHSSRLPGNLQTHVQRSHQQSEETGKQINLASAKAPVVAALKKKKKRHKTKQRFLVFKREKKDTWHAFTSIDILLLLQNYPFVFQMER